MHDSRRFPDFGVKSIERLICREMPRMNGLIGAELTALLYGHILQVDGDAPAPLQLHDTPATRQCDAKIIGQHLRVSVERTR